MADQVYFDDVKEGLELPEVRKDPTTQQLVMYAGASGDYYQIHYDLEFAKSNGLPDVILHGALKNAFLGQIMTNWERSRSSASSIEAWTCPEPPPSSRASSRRHTRKTARTLSSARSGSRTTKAHAQRQARRWCLCPSGANRQVAVERRRSFRFDFERFRRSATCRRGGFQTLPPVVCDDSGAYRT